MKHYWLMKSEPMSFSIDDLAKKPKQTEPWDGVRNYRARNFLQAMKLGDLAFFYHSSCPHPGIVGVIKIVRSAYPDKTAFDSSNHHYDQKSKVEKPTWFCVDVQLVHIFKQIISLQTLKNLPHLSSMLLLKQGNRLSIMPISSEEWEAIIRLT